jgi:VIT1/CCC1 family predicted Fe2+/Mn2+ transporter
MRRDPHGAGHARLRANLQTEIDSGYLYETLAAVEPREDLARVYHELAASEHRHADHWRRQLAKEGVAGAPTGPSLRARILARLAGRFGPGIILPTLAEAERAMGEAAQLAKRRWGLEPSGLENTHGALLETMQQASRHGMQGGAIARFEGRHRSMGGNMLRAAVLGANDGLVSNLSLMMGMAGAAESRGPVLVAGVAGLLAGAISMALGEWLSVQSARELNERQIDIEREELEHTPEEEAAELALIYQAKGLSEEEARQLAARLLSGDRETAVATLAAEELGLDVGDLGGSAWEAALGSFMLFTLGAGVPLLAFWAAPAAAAKTVCLVASALGLFAIGAAITLMTGRSVWYSGTRQLAFGLAAAAVTYGVGRAFGVAVAG